MDLSGYRDELSRDLSHRFRDLEGRGFTPAQLPVNLSPAKSKIFGSGLKPASSDQRGHILTWEDGLSLYLDQPRRGRPVLAATDEWSAVEPIDSAKGGRLLFFSLEGREWAIQAGKNDRATPQLLDAIAEGSWDRLPDFMKQQY